MSTLPRSRHAAAMSKARGDGYAGKAKACLLSRTTQPHGHLAKAKAALWACYQGQHSPKGTQPRLKHLVKAKLAPMGMLLGQGSPIGYVAKDKACSSQGQDLSP
nr:hypothetical protein CFP56_45730 [Quercus suber]